MNLRSGNFYRSGRVAREDTVSRVSTDESVTGPTRSRLTPIQEYASDSLSDSSMSQTSVPAASVNTFPVDLAYNIRLVFVRENEHKAKIYRDPYNKFAVKIEDHASEFEEAPIVSYQEDRYIGQNGDLYLLTVTPEDVDQLGTPVGLLGPVEEAPPMHPATGYQVVDSFATQFLSTEGLTMYGWDDGENERVYGAHNVPEHTIAEQKILYVFKGPETEGYPRKQYLDKYGVAYDEVFATEDTKGKEKVGEPSSPAPTLDMRGRRPGSPAIGTPSSSMPNRAYANVDRAEGSGYTASYVPDPIAPPSTTPLAPPQRIETPMYRLPVGEPGSSLGQRAALPVRNVSYAPPVQPIPVVPMDPRGSIGSF